MLKIAIMVRYETSNRCTGKGCLKSFFAKSESFARYEGMEVELVGFFHSGGDMEYKLDKLQEAGVQVVHVSTCMRAKHPNYEQLVRELAKRFDVIGYTHGSEHGRTRKTVTIIGKHIDK